MKAVTQWFPMTEKPARPGVYEFNHPVYRYSFWTGTYWAVADDEIESAVDPVWLQYESDVAHDPSEVTGWRGLAEDPSIAPAEVHHV